MSKRILTKSTIFDKKYSSRKYFIDREKNRKVIVIYICSFLTSIFLYLRSSAFFIDHCGNEIISRTSDQPIEKE